MEKEILTGKTLVELQQLALEEGLPAFTARQIAEWLYRKKAADIAQMTNISLKNREMLQKKYTTGRVAPIEVTTSADGTKKYLFPTPNGCVETVFIPEDDRATLCVSSQAGCKMGCAFCMTGKQGFSGQLSAAEILNQILAVPETDELTNIVFMGMGEPFDNTLAVLRALEILTADYGFAWSPRRITVSTIGLIPGMKTFLEKSQCHLAVSLHNPFPAERLALMPAEKAYPFAEVLKWVQKTDFAHQRRVSFEYIMFEGKNDSPRHAREVVRLLAPLKCRVNLIRFHAIPNVDLQPSSEEKIVRFRDYLNENNIIATIRKSRGEDILAACGMLSGMKM